MKIFHMDTHKWARLARWDGVFFKMKYESVRELLRSFKILNVYQINILNNAFFMHRTNTNSAPIVFLDKLTKPAHLYPARFSQIHCSKPTHKLNRCKYRISIKLY